MEKSNKSFFSILFDVSFKSFVTLRLVSVLYVISIIFWFFISVAVFGTSLLTGSLIHVILYLFVSVFLFFGGVIFSRLSLETLIVLFRIAENTSEITEILKELKSEIGRRRQR